VSHSEIDLGTQGDVLPAQGPSADADVAAVQRVGLALHLALERAVLRMRLEGGSWAAVARALGTSRQAAWKRFKYLDDECSGVTLRVQVVEGRRRAAWYSLDLGEELHAGRRTDGVLLAGRALRAIAAASR
jgi:hypothetical protein